MKRQKADLEKAIAILDRFIEHPEKWNHPVNLWGQPDIEGQGKRCGVSGMISPELIQAAIEERERLTVLLSRKGDQ
jgi:hypothetical protein